MNWQIVRAGLNTLSIAIGLAAMPVMAQTPNMTPRPRSVSGAYQSINGSGSQIAELPAGTENSFVIYDTANQQATLYNLEPNTDVVRVALSRDGRLAAALVNERTSIQSQTTGKTYFQEQRRLILIDTLAGTYRPVKSNANDYNPELAFDSTGAYLFYARSTEDIHRRDVTGPVTRYTHQYFCCSAGAYVARYALDTQTEEIVGPFMAPQGNMLSGLQVTATNIFFYAFGLTRAIEFNYDPAAPSEVQDEVGKTVSDAFSSLFLAHHPSDIETYTEKDHGFLERMLFRMPTGDIGMKGHVPLSKASDWGIGPADGQTNVALKMETLHPIFSDDEKTIVFYINGHRCWGDVAEGQVATCEDPRDGGLLSHDGKRMVFLTQGQRPLGNHGRTVTPRLCTIERHQTVKACKWRKVDTLMQKVVNVTPAN
ncbi:hypothetical protein [Asticcacaulis sp. 201]|uniref:hypothetical protein n=1 Tax=Asticcacaulis sp. 201 TaxID=3028787 RepID=UPI002916CB12|nr:hypothetical protein [Asticcacaulis sp. 201]MDV6330126.1 hypothetical protein [Asticcacaulis sp. 201]